MRLPHSPVLLVIAGLCLSACGAGGAAAVAAATRSTSGGDDPTPSPRVEITAPPLAANHVALQVKLSDSQVRASGEESPRVRITPRFRRAHGIHWKPMTEAPVSKSSGTRGLPLGQHVFVWNTLVDLGGDTDVAQVRFEAEYEDTAGRKRKFRPGEVELTVDNRLATSLLGGGADSEAGASTLPVDLLADGSGFLVAAEGSNVVESVSASALTSRVVGLGIPGSSVTGTMRPGVVRLPSIRGLAIDAGNNLWTAHESSVLFTNRGDAGKMVGTRYAAPGTVVNVIDGLADVRSIRFHPSGLLLLLEGSGGTARLAAYNPGAPRSLGTVEVASASVVPVAGGGLGTVDGGAVSDADLSAATALAVGPEGEVYLAERDLGRVRVLNLGTGPLTIGGFVVAAGTVQTVAGGTGTGWSGDGGPAGTAQFGRLGGIAVTADHGLLIVDSGNSRLRAANLSESPMEFGGVRIDPGSVDTVAGGGPGAIGSLGTDILLAEPLAVGLDPAGHILVTSREFVILLNRHSGTIDAYGQRMGTGRTAIVYDGAARQGRPLQGPRAIHLLTPQALHAFLSDRTTVRVLNLSASPEIWAGAMSRPGGSAVIAGGALPGFSGDGGPAAAAEFSSPSALASPPAPRTEDIVPLLFVADTDNDRVRVINLGEAGVSPAITTLGVTVPAGDVNTVAGGAVENPVREGDGLPPRSASLSRPQGVAVARIDSQEVLFIADTGQHRIRAVNGGPKDLHLGDIVVGGGTIETVAGDGSAGFSADGIGPWQLDTPTALAWHDGVLYFGEPGNARIRSINFGSETVRLAGVEILPGEMRTLVGTGVRGWSADGDLGPNVETDSPSGLFLQTRGGQPHALFFSDRAQQLVRVLNLTEKDHEVDDGRVPPGSVVTIAGGPNLPGFPNPPSFSGDSEPPIEVRFAAPRGIVWMSFNIRASHFLVADELNDRIRRFGAPRTRPPQVGP